MPIHDTLSDPVKDQVTITIPVIAEAKEGISLSGGRVPEGQIVGCSQAFGSRSSNTYVSYRSANPAGTAHGFLPGEVVSRTEPRCAVGEFSGLFKIVLL